jgi:molybdopterin synthase sulfur carrier subunit
MRVQYFAWVRERIGRTEEEVEPPATVRTLGEFIGWLAQQGEEYQFAFIAPNAVRGALDRVHATKDTLIAGAKEIALFPPMTGG